MIKPRVYRIMNRTFVRFDCYDCEYEVYNIVIHLKRKIIFDETISVKQSKLYEIPILLSGSDILWFYIRRQDDSMRYITKLVVTQNAKIIDTQRLSNAFVVETKKSIKERMEKLKYE